MYARHVMNACGYTLLVLALIQVLIGITLIVKMQSNRREIRRFLTVELQRNYSESKNYWDATQSFFRCCGVNCADDWLTIEPYSIPENCCPIMVGVCTVDKAYPKGCVEKITTFSLVYCWIFASGGLLSGILYICVSVVVHRKGRRRVRFSNRVSVQSKENGEITTATLY